MAHTLDEWGGIARRGSPPSTSRCVSVDIAVKPLKQGRAMEERWIYDAIV